MPFVKTDNPIIEYPSGRRVSRDQLPQPQTTNPLEAEIRQLKEQGVSIEKALKAADELGEEGTREKIIKIYAEDTNSDNTGDKS